MNLPTRLALTVLAALSAPEGALAQQPKQNDLFLLRGPYLQIGTSTSVRVRWRFSAPADAVISYGLTPNSLTQTLTDPVVARDHEIEIGGLQPDTTYWYSVGTSTRAYAEGPEYFFHTAPAPGTPRPFRIWAFGDSGTAGQKAETVRDGYLEFAQGQVADVLLLLGDQAYGAGTDVQFQRALFEMYSEQLRNTVAWITRGNHELHEDVYFGIFSLPRAGEAGGVPSGTEAYYSFDYANAHFVCLDSFATSRAEGDAMWTWLDSDLAATDQDWIIAFWHHPPYSKGQHSSDVEIQSIEMRENFLPLFESYGVDLVLTGHSHSYERSFLVDGHYGTTDEYDPSMAKDPGNGFEEGDGAYVKAPGPHAGAVFCVAGSAADVRNGDFDHPVMVMADAILGTLVLDVDGGRIDVSFVGIGGQVADRFTVLGPTYAGKFCAAEPHSEGCVATMDSVGEPSASSSAPFILRARQVRSQAVGALRYGLAPTNQPGRDGRLCVGSPWQTLGPLVAGGFQPCQGFFGLDFNQHIQSGVDGNLQPGTVVYCQYWFTDGAKQAMSDALMFTILP